MPIVYIHGVNTRSRAGVEALAQPFRRWVAPAIRPGDPGSVGYHPVFWGDIAASFRWNLASRPRTQLLSAGAGGAAREIATARSAPRALMRAPLAPAAPVAGGGGVIGGNVIAAGPAAAPRPAAPLNVAPGDRPDVLSDLYLAARAAEAEAGPAADLPVRLAALHDQAAALPLAAAEVAETMWPGQGGATDAKLAEMLAAIHVRLIGAVSAGPADWFARAGELARRALLLPGDLVSTVLAEARPALNLFVANFLGDVLTYTNERGRSDSPGPIPRRVIEAVRAAKRGAQGEPLVVVTHSMGGQLFYDFMMHFAAADPEFGDLKIDHWISCGAQVSFFAELGQFIGQDPGVRSPARLRRPPGVERWTNFYDPNDLVGFVMEPVFDGVKDREYDSGAGLALAHTSYLQRPSFFEAMGSAIRNG
ncbi:MAG TPA: hypothetical protein VGB79_10800 [Allosphingosinicella sp.]|jgi:hypothetical protein